jgi:hypothetical protein
LEIKQFSTLGKIILKNIYIAHYKLRILMKMIKTNPNYAKGPDNGKIVNKLYCIVLTTL